MGNDMIVYDGFVRLGDSRPAGEPDECFYCRAKMGTQHNDGCVIIQERVLDASPIGEWQPIETYQDGDFVLFWFPKGERGVGGKETAMACRDASGVIHSGWSHGGPNSGHYFDFCEQPTMWCRLPEDPIADILTNLPRNDDT